MLSAVTSISTYEDSSVDTLKRIRILIVDDQEFVRKGLRAVIQPEADMEVVGEATNGIEAIEAALALMPDVVLMDILMPELDGIEATKRIATVTPLVRVLILSQLEERRYVERARAYGAAGYFPKALGIDELRGAIRTLAAGGSKFD